MSEGVAAPPKESFLKGIFCCFPNSTQEAINHAPGSLQNGSSEFGRSYKFVDEAVDHSFH